MNDIKIRRKKAKPDHGLRTLFFEHIPRAQWTAIETAPVSIGVPDSEYALPGVTGWIEFKATKHWRVNLASLQVGWIARRARLGGRVWIAVQRAEDELWLVPGSVVEQLSTKGLNTVRSHARIWLKPWNWDQVQDMLMLYC